MGITVVIITRGQHLPSGSHIVTGTADYREYLRSVLCKLGDWIIIRWANRFAANDQGVCITEIKYQMHNSI